MSSTVAQEIGALKRLKVKELRDRYQAVFNEETNAQNKAWLIKRIAWRLQSLAEGDLSERARQRARELANDADVRLNPPKAPPPSVAAERTTSHAVAIKSDDRLPPPGTILTRPYKGELLQVCVLPVGFEYGGETYASLSAVAKVITGSHCNGFQFFKLTGAGGAA